MKKNGKVLALIPARGGSKGLPGKNVRPLAGVPLIVHSILMAKMCPEIARVVVSTDDEKIAAVARESGAEVPFLRPAVLAQDETPMWPVLRHALGAVEQEKRNESSEYLLLLDPTSPGRMPEDVHNALQKLIVTSNADGIVGASRPEFNPIWHCVYEKEGWMSDLFDAGATFGRRQDVPSVYRINASLYIWRTEFVRKEKEDWRKNGKHLLFEIPESRAIHIDTLEEFEKAELFLKYGHIHFPWLR